MAETPETQRDFGTELRDATAACRLTISRAGTRCKLSAEQHRQQAELFGADPAYLTGSKRLLNTKHSLFKAISSTLSEARSVWHAMTTPFPERGIRLLRRERVPKFVAEVERLKAQLAEQAEALEGVYRSELIPEARERLGSLFSEQDYPATIADRWELGCDFPSVDAPEYLRQLNPALYEREQQRARQRFETAVQLAEQAFAEQLGELVSHLATTLTPREVHHYRYTGDHPEDVRVMIEEAEREMRGAESRAEGERAAEERDQLLSLLPVADAVAIERREERVTLRYEDRKPQTVSTTHASEDAAREWLTNHQCQHERTEQERRKFAKSAVTNLDEFFQRFADLSIGSNSELEAMVERARQLVSGTTPDALRDGTESARAALREPLAEIAETLEAMTQTAGSRQITLADEGEDE